MTHLTGRPHVDPEAFRQALASVCTPVAVVTTLDDGQPFGTTVSAFSSLSLDPPLVLVALDRGSDLLAHIARSGRYGINVLAAGQAGLAGAFARKGVDKFVDVGWELDCELPRLHGTGTFLACAAQQLLDGGDHVIVPGLVEHAEAHAAPPLLYRNRRFGTLEDPAMRGGD
jgi:flavin reductase (DIM6/NTAB) family NADH-FMN oxidoreductase RutF